MTEKKGSCFTRMNKAGGKYTTCKSAQKKRKRVAVKKKAMKNPRRSSRLAKKKK